MPRSPNKVIPKARSRSPSVKADQAPSGDAFAQALAAFQAGRLEEAEAILRGILARTPDDAGCWNNLGNLLQEVRRLDEAEAAFRRAIALLPDHPEFHNNLGNLFKLARRLPEAEAAYRRGIECKPDNPATYNLLGILCTEAGKLDDAEAAYHRALELNPEFADAHNNLGILFKAAGKPAEAEAEYRRALQLDPEFAEAHNNLGILLLEDKRFPEGEAAFRRALEIRADFADAHSNLGNLLKQTKHLSEAELAYVRAIELNPDFPDAHNNLGILQKEAGKLPEAEAAYRRALELNPDFAEAHDNLGVLLLEEERYPEAEATFRRALDIKPDFADVHSNLGNLLKQTKRLPEAERAYRRAIELKPDEAGAYNNLAILLSQTARLAEAEQNFRRAIELKPEFVEAHNNLGNLLKEMNRLPEAEAAYRSALELKPESVDARLNIALLLLSLGRYEEAWPWHEARYFPDSKARKAMQPPFSFPQWQGEPLAGKSLVVVLEQGAGDNFQFVRYAPLLKAQGLARLSYVQPGPFIPLLGTAHGIDSIAPDAASTEPHDYWVFPLSLPFHLGTTLETIPDTLPYLWALPERVERWRPRLPTSGFKVGLVWKGNPDHQNDANRSLPHLSTLAPLWDVPGVSFVSLQKGRGEDEARNPPAAQSLVHLGDEIADFADTAAIIDQLDLLITIDSAAAHVAGALGKPVWVLLPGFGTDWRWLLDREDSPWYPGVMRLFRQPREASSWEATVREVAAALKTRIEARKSEMPFASFHESELPQRSTVSVVASPAPAEDTFANALAAFQSGRLQEAEAILRRMLERFPDDAGCWNNLGNLLQETRRLEEAEAAFRKAIALTPDRPEFHSNLGNLFRLAQRLPEAEAAYRRAIDCMPDNPASHNQLGLLLTAAGKQAEAELAYGRALELNPGFADVHNNLGILFKQSEKPAAAEAAYRRALELNPGFAEALNNLGIVLFEDDRFTEAEAVFRRALELNPDFADAHSNLGNLLKEAQRLSEAEAAYRRALDLQPADAKAYNNLGVLLHEGQRFDEAEAAYRRGLALDPGFAEAHANLGILLQHLNRLPEAEAAYRRALELKPDHTDSRLNLGLLLLSLGRYLEAWPYHEARYFPDTKERKAMHPRLPYPQWQGESLAGKSLVVGTEQGYGDNIQFVRYVPLLKSLGLARLTLMQTRALAPLIQTVDDGVEVVTDVATLPAYDYWCFALSLPLHLGTTVATIPATIPYLHVLPERAALWRGRLPPGGFKLGLIWKGNPEHKNDLRRSLPGLSALAPLWDIPGISFISLQKGQGEDDARHPPATQPLLHLGDDIGDFADTAAIIDQLDLLITIDSAAAHVAGALGRPVWVLLPGVGTDWRWLREREDSPWYPGPMRLFRQAREASSWDGTIQDVATALRARVAAAPGATALLSEQPPQEDADSLNRRAILLHESRRTQEAVFFFRRALALNPDFAAAHCGLGNALSALGLLDEAEAAYRNAIAAAPEFIDAKVCLGILLLTRGRYADAWPWFDAGHAPDPEARRVVQPPFGFPRWQGEPLAGKSLVVVNEQGHGDNVQFARYAPLLKAQGLARLSYVQPPQAIPLLGTAQGIDVITAEAMSLPAHDYWCFALSIPLHLGTTVDTIPASLPYLRTLPERIEKWRSRMPTGNASGLRVGLVWKGNPGHGNDAYRSLPHLSVLAPLWETPGVSFISLQMGPGEDEVRQVASSQPLLHLGADIGDFADTAAIVAQLDLVIAVDTAVVHVAGALGRPVWVLLPGVGTDWRWLLDREDSPWYPGVMRLFRQPRGTSSWDSTIRNVATALRDWSAAEQAMTPAEEEAACRDLIAIMPESAQHHFHLGALLHGQGVRPAEAEAEYRYTLRLDPAFPGATWNLALLLLEQGRWAEAWPHFERRSDPFRPGFAAQYPCPEWRGESLTGKSLVIDTCEGPGDNIMCARYVPLLKAAGASRITLRHNASLKTLLETVAGVDAVVTDPRALAPHDFWCFSFSLPVRFATIPETIPAKIPYVFTLDARRAYWRRRLAPMQGFRVGLVWKDGPNDDADGDRSLPGLATLAPLWEVPGVSFVSLQKGPGEEEGSHPPAGLTLQHLAGDIDDFADSAAIIAELDLLISVDTAVAHVAGALGRPVWLLLPQRSDWRWLRDREDTPWYPGVMRLFRQSKQAPSWEAEIRDVAAALAACVRGEADLVPAQRPPALPSVLPAALPAALAFAAETTVRLSATASSMELSMNRPVIRPLAFVLAASDHGTLIVNRNDYATQGDGSFGVGYQVLNNSSFDPAEIDFALRMLEFRRKFFGDGVMALDCGANIGIHTVEWARLMHGWGSVTAVEAQERVFYALCGNITINNCFNARALWGAIGAEEGEIMVPRPNYLRPGSFGSLEIRPSSRNEFIGQPIDYSAQAGQLTRLFSIDSLGLPRLDLIKIDIEGMEMEALTGAINTIRRFRPQMLIEKIKSDEAALRAWLLAEGYRVASFGLNLVAVHGSDPSHEHLLT